jgi:N-acetylmuramic acid 6-phosphate etherase
LLTEQQNPNTLNIDNLDTLEVLRVINDEDQKVALAVKTVLPNIAQAVDAIVHAIRHNGRLLYVGAGASGRTGVIDAVECVPTYGTPPDLVLGILAGGEKAMMRSVEGAEDDRDLAIRDLQHVNLTADDIVVGIAASGTTPYVLSAIAYAKSLGCVTVGISCNQPAPLLDDAHIAIPLLVGAEVITGSTRMKAGTAQKLVLNMLSTASMVRLGKVYGNLMVDVQTTNIKLVDRAVRIVMQITEVPRETAQYLLEKANGSAKVAIVMHRRSVTAEEARQLLATHNGQLRAVIG